MEFAPCSFQPRKYTPDPEATLVNALNVGAPQPFLFVLGPWGPKGPLSQGVKGLC